MKRLIFIILSVFALFIMSIRIYALPAGEFPVCNEGTEILTVLGACNKQPRPTFTTEMKNLDTVWILFTNGDFRQYVIMDNEIRMYSEGTYSQGTDDSLVINRTRKHMEGAGFQNYSSIHAYILNANEYVQLAASDSPERQTAAIFWDMEQEPYSDENGMKILLDTIRIFYSDGTFDQYVSWEKNMILLNTGEYSSFDCENHTALYIKE